MNEDWLATATDVPTEAAMGDALVRLALVLPEGHHYVATLRKTVRCLLESVGVEPEDQDDIELAIGELATNAMLHGDAPFSLCINYHRDRVVLFVSDHGRGLVPSGQSGRSDTAAFTKMPSVSDIAQQLESISEPTVLSAPSGPSDRPSEPPCPSLGTDTGRFGGWGLPLVHRITERVDVLPHQPQGTIVRAEKRIRPSAR
jgi:anti-sigma regulatory factor (Ser/Thr protein kinase)